MLTVVHDADASNENGTSGGSLLDEIVRDGARAMLAAAWQAEVAAYIDAHLGEVDENGYRLVGRNGYHGEREVLTAAGAVSVKAPRVNDKRIDPDTGERRSPALGLGDLQDLGGVAAHRGQLQPPQRGVEIGSQRGHR